jgi:hypothetical protein
MNDSPGIDSAIDVMGDPQSRQKFLWTGFSLSPVWSNVFRVPLTQSAKLGTPMMLRRMFRSASDSPYSGKPP